jgi:hypothetical protein
MPKSFSQVVVESYAPMVNEKYPALASRWPILCGFNLITGPFNEYAILIFKDTGIIGSTFTSLSDFTAQNLGVNVIDQNNIESVKNKIAKDYNLSFRDSVLILKQDLSNLDDELLNLLKRHEIVMEITSTKIFLSHKGIDKARVRDYKETLKLIGFEPWLDEDAMSAGVVLERGIKKGFEESCAAVFFVTPNFIDEDYLSSEVDYAIAEKRKKHDNFSIITLVFEDGKNKGTVPELLTTYVWKEPKTDLEALREIIKAIPLKTGNITIK